MPDTIEKAELAGLSDLHDKDQLLVDFSQKKLYVFTNRLKEVGLQKVIPHSEMYREVFNDQKVRPKEARLILWHYYRVFTELYIEDQGSFILIFCNGRVCPN